MLLRTMQRPAGIGGMRPARRRAAYRTFARGTGGSASGPLFGKGDTGTGDSRFVAGTDSPLLIWREPVLVRLPSGTLLAFAEGHQVNGANGDWGCSCIGMRRSTTRGLTWEPIVIVYHDTSWNQSAGTAQWMNMGAVSVNPTTGKTHLFISRFFNGTAGVVATIDDVQNWYIAITADGVTIAAPTNRTSECKKGVNQTAPFDAQNANWGWNICGPGQGITLADGSQVITCGHRYTKDTSGTAYWHAMVTTDDWATITLRGPTESTMLTGTLEPAVTVGTLPTTIVAVCRNNGVDTNKLVFTSSNSGTAWDNGTAVNALAGKAAPVGLCSISGVIYCSLLVDQDLRACMAVTRSLNNGGAWSTPRIIDDRMGGYSSLIAVDSNSLACAYECIGETSDIVAAGLTPNDRIELRRFPKSLVTSTTPRQYVLYFNERTSGAIPTTGRPIKGHTADGGDAKGAANGTFTAIGAKCNGTGRGITLCERQTGGLRGGWTDIRSDSVTWEFGYKPTSGSGSRAILDNRNGTAGQRGFTLLLDASHHLVLTIDDGTNTAVATGTTAINNGTLYRIRWQWNASTKVASIYLNGVLEATDTEASMTLANLVGAQANGCVLGSLTGDGSPHVFEITDLRVTRGILTSGFWDGTETKEALSVLEPLAATAIPAGDPQTVLGSALKLYLCPTYDDGYSGSMDAYGGWDKQGTRRVGDGACSFIDKVTNKRFNCGPQGGVNRPAFWDSDAQIGPHWRLNWQTTGALSGMLTIDKADIDLDFIHKTGLFTIAMIVKAVTVPALVSLFDNAKNSASNCGISILRDSANIYVRLCDGSGTSVINKTFNTAHGSSNFNFIVVQGTGTHLKIINKAFTGSPGAIGTLTAPNITAWTGATPNGSAATATENLGIGGYADGSTGMANQRIKNIIVTNTEVDLGNVAADSPILKALATYGVGL